ncbi:Enoyl-(Acyl carrier protein) reductase [Pedobacter westerhofensis]|uniref:Enoyl-(Acyl carrier protein) reductase n=1 Tax=Pedobacter westerhofensis TaxID=425512 RepID=A0A521AAT7_9SPHI|nr:Enoyl-(Acyl carrier protein) reductase [Pedobacter westerhofensis]
MYDASKFAIERFCESLAYELAPLNIGVKIIEPGIVVTELVDKAPAVAHPNYQDLADSMAKTFSLDGASKSDDIAEVVYQAATDGSSKLRYICGEDAIQFYAKRMEFGDEAFIKDMHQLIDVAKSNSSFTPKQ